jgi:hypothetical protein
MAMITITINGDVLNADKTKAIKNLELDKLRLIEELKAEAYKNPRYIAAFDLAGHSDSTGSKNRPTLFWNGKAFTANVVMDEVVATPKPYVMPVHQVHIDPRTMNALLGGKLLSDVEKRKLLASVLPAGVLEKPLKEEE